MITVPHSFSAWDFLYILQVLTRFYLGFAPLSMVSQHIITIPIFISLRLEKSRDLLNEKQELLGKLSWELTEMDLKSEELVESMR